MTYRSECLFQASGKLSVFVIERGREEGEEEGQAGFEEESEDGCLI